MFFICRIGIIILLTTNIPLSKATEFTAKQLSLLMTTTQEHEHKKQLFWHHTIPTVGLRPNNKDADCFFIPHCFSLRDLAPRKGKGAKVAVIDTGIIARSIDKYYFEFHPQLNHQLFFFPDCLNLMNHDIQDVIHTFTALLIKYSGVLLYECQKEVVHFLYEYSSTKTFYSLINFLKKHSCYAAHAIQEFKSMFDYYEKKRSFTPIKLDKYDKPIFLELLPITQDTYYMADHGTVLCGLIGARDHTTIGPLGIAPEAEIIMIKAFDEYGCSNKATLLQALTKVRELGISIVNISLKISDYWSHDDLVSQKIEQTITQIPYVIAACGNCADAHAMKHEAYPARLPSVAFDVGAFTFDGNTTYSIASFSQYEPTVGPKIVAPGFNILSTTLTDDPAIEYGLFHGTSIATALVTGFVALLVSEFGECFTREQLLKVCYKATVRLHTTNEWQTKTLLGTIDMRCALFMLHALYRFKELNIIKGNDSYDFSRDFDGLLLIIHTILYESSHNCSFLIHDKGMSSDLIQIKEFHNKVPPYFSNSAQAVEFVVSKMFLLVSTDIISSFSFSINLFPLLSSNAQRRIESVF